MAKKIHNDRAMKILKILKKTYPDAKIALNYNSPFELLIATILSAQCTDERVNIVTKKLFSKYKHPEDYVKVEAVELEDDIRSTGFYKQKTKSIQNAAAMLIDEYNSEVPDNMDDLIKLPGVARKTANIVLGNGMGITAGIAVDTHVKRLSQLLDLSKNSQPDKIEADLMEQIPKRDWTAFSHLLQAHGRAVCKARKPRCNECKLNELCPSSLI
ncbi:MAG: endonuclease III [Thermoplasmata archaeon]|nr:MAG: endonuclease III [Thermoplasmata archaeon]